MQKGQHDDVHLLGKAYVDVPLHSIVSTITCLAIGSHTQPEAMFALARDCVDDNSFYVSNLVLATLCTHSHLLV